MHQARQVRRNLCTAISNLGHAPRVVVGFTQICLTYYRNRVWPCLCQKSFLLSFFRRNHACRHACVSKFVPRLIRVRVCVCCVYYILSFPRKLSFSLFPACSRFYSSVVFLSSDFTGNDFFDIAFFFSLSLFSF